MSKAYHIKLAVIISLFTFFSCNKDNLVREDEMVEVSITAKIPIDTRSSDPGPDVINDLNLFIVNQYGIVEQHIYLQKKNPSNEYSLKTRLIKNLKYSFYAGVNFGYEMPDIKTITELKKYRYYLTYPDEYSHGMPMFGQAEHFIISKKNETIQLELERLMARISVTIDRRALKKDVKFIVKSIEVGNCPRSICPSEASHAKNQSDLFGIGFIKSYVESDGLNIDLYPGISNEVNLYMFENMNGTKLSNVCSYIEIKAIYESEKYFTLPGDCLIYRFYIGEEKNNYNIRRNTSYRFTVKPEADGLKEDSWRVDKSGLTKKGKGTIILKPGNYIEGKIGDTVHIYAETIPKDSYLKIGKEELDFDKERGIYDYKINEDKRGVTLYLKGKGTGILYFEAGYPTSDSAAAVILVK